MAARSKPRRGTPPTEWALAAAGGALLLALIGYMVFLGWHYPSGPPELSVSVIGQRPSEAGHVVEFRAENNGGSAVENVTVEASLLSEGDAVERREVMLPELPQRADQRGAVLFALDPADHELELRIEGYALP